MLKFLVPLFLLGVASAKPSPYSLSSSSSPSSSASSGNLLQYKAALIPEPSHVVIAEPAHVAIAEPTLARVGDFLQSVPTAVSHQSSTIVHGRANVVHPIVAPGVQTRLAPAIHSYVAPLVHHHNIAGAAAIASPSLNTIPVLSYYAEPYYYAGDVNQENQQQLYKSVA